MPCQRLISRILTQGEVIGSHGTETIRREVVNTGPSVMSLQRTLKTLRSGCQIVMVSRIDCQRKRNGNSPRATDPKEPYSRGVIHGRKDLPISMASRVRTRWDRFLKALRKPAFWIWLATPGNGRLQKRNFTMAGLLMLIR